MKKRILTSILIFILTIATIGSEVQGKTEPYEWVKNNRFVAHALGGIDGKAYTNSLEALEANYKKGYKVFEVDLVLTSDNELVARHDWLEMFEQKLHESPKDNNKPISLKQFKATKIHRKYTPLDFKDICVFMNKHKDVYLITDTKGIDEKSINESFKVMIDTAKKVNKGILERIVPQIYNQEMLPLIKNFYEFQNVIYTLYMSHDTDEQVADFVVKNKIKVVTMSARRCTKEFVNKLSSKGVYTYVHTINLITDTENLINEKGIYGIYSDFLIPSDIQYMNIKNK